MVRAGQGAQERSFETDMVVHGAGRVPDLDDLDLDTAGVKREKRGVSVNQFLQSVSNPAVFAWIKQNNPHLQNMNRLKVGMQLTFPPLPREVR